MSANQQKQYKVFNDPIHGSIEMHPYLVCIIDTPEFQRLRDIRQMGGVYHVYPGASHKRFEHSIGVAHLAGELVQALRKQHCDEEDKSITEDEGLSVQIAALCHDLGHGPFSHLFDDLFIPKVLVKLKNEVRYEGELPNEMEEDLRGINKRLNAVEACLRAMQNKPDELREIGQNLNNILGEIKTAEGQGNIEGQRQAEGEGNIEGQRQAEGEGNIEGQRQAEGEGNIEGQRQAEGEGNIEGQRQAEGQGNIEGQRQAEGEGNIEGRGQTIEELKRKYGDVKRQFKTKALGNWTHEKQSIIMLDAIMNRIQSEDTEKYRSFIDFMRDNLAFIKELIDPPEGQKSNRKTFLYEIVSNKRNGIDVDKMDYFARDCYHLGIENNFNYRRFMKFARVCEFNGEMQICMRDKEVGNIYDLFHTRNNIHRKACQHKVVRAIDTMIVDALLAADEFLGISDSALSGNINDYLNMTDTIIQRILDDEKCEESKAILNRIKDRDLYKCVLELRHSGQPFKEILQGKETSDFSSDASDIKKIFVQDALKELAKEIGETPEDIDMKLIDMTYGMKGKNPTDQMRFYRKRDLDKAITLGKRDVSRLLPSNFAEQLIHVYCKKPKMSYEITTLESKTKAWFKKNNYVENFEGKYKVPTSFYPLDHANMPKQLEESCVKANNLQLLFEDFGKQIHQAIKEK